MRRHAGELEAKVEARATEMQEVNKQLQEASHHKSRFLANMSHELRTPLDAILGHTELILNEIYGEVPGKIRDVLQRVHNSGRHLLGLINDFTEGGEVGILAMASDGQFLVAVSDTGPGISEADQQGIFEEFQQGDDSGARDKGGTGLGLSIARRIIEIHRGHMWVESTLWKGSTFWFALPVLIEQ